MPDPLSNPPEKAVKKSYSDFQIFLFVIFLCLICGLLLALISFSLQKAQTDAKEFDQSKQMLIAAKILNHEGFFLILDNEDQLRLAKWDSSTQTLIPVEKDQAPKATEEEIKQISTLRIRPLLTNNQGELFTLEEKKISLPEYLAENKKAGYADLPLKLFYAILPNKKEAKDISAEQVAKNIHEASAYVFPVSGFGLWAPIYGYIAIGPDGNEVIGTTWYEHGETPGLGANIAEPWWQKQFLGKEIFQESSSGKSDFQTANVGIIVVKGKVRDVYGNSPKSMNAVDGMSGATLTGDGVTQAYRNSLSPYRPLLIKIHESFEKDSKNKEKSSPSNQEGRKNG